MDTRGTIVAIASPPGRGARGIVRLSGGGTPGALAELLESVPEDAGAHRVRVRLGERSLGALLLMYRSPRSYTGQDGAELILPGNPHLLGRVVERLVALPGVRRAGPGEFTARAYLAGKLTLDQAEGVAKSIAADSAAELDAARALLTGEVGGRYRAWADACAAMLALVEVGVDFTDQEDVVPIAPGELAARVHDLRSRVLEQLGDEVANEPEADEPMVVLVGAPNAGKSTLFNALLGRQRAVVADDAGTTRDALVDVLDLSHDLPGAGAVRLVDVPGLEDDANGLIDKAMQARARALIGDADVLVHCDPAGWFGAVGDGSAPTIRVRTKADLVTSETREEPHARRTDRGGVDVCAFDGYHLSALRRAIADAAGGARGAGRSLVVPRHRHAMATAVDQLDEVLSLFDARARALDEPELVAGGLRAALDAIGELAGAVSPDDVIGRVFASFCVGK